MEQLVDVDLDVGLHSKREVRYGAAGLVAGRCCGRPMTR